MQKKASTKGFTLLELLIALAVLAIIAAILIPNFFATTDRARLRSDVQSTRVIQNAMELYRAERGDYPAPTAATSGGATNNAQAIVNHLAVTGFLSDNSEPQSDLAVWAYSAAQGFTVNITGSPEGVQRAFRNLSTAEQSFVTGGTI